MEIVNQTVLQPVYDPITENLQKSLARAHQIRQAK